MSTSSAVPKIKVRLRTHMTHVRLMQGIKCAAAPGDSRYVIVAIGYDGLPKRRVGAILPVQGDWLPNGEEPIVIIFPEPEKGHQPHTHGQLLAAIVETHLTGIVTPQWNWKHCQKGPPPARLPYRGRF